MTRSAFSARLRRVLLLVGLVLAVVPAGSALACIELPTGTNQCKHGGWKSFGSTFKNQGDCVSYVATGGKNPPNG